MPTAWLGELGLIVAATKPRNAPLPSDIKNLADGADKGGGLFLVTDDDGAELRLHGIKGQKGKVYKAVLSSDRDSSSLYLFGEGTLANLGVSSFPGSKRFPDIPEYASLDLAQSALNPQEPMQRLPRQVSLKLNIDGSSDLAFSDIALNKFASFAVDVNGVPTLNLFDAGSETRGQFALTQDGDPFLSLWGKGEKTYVCETRVF